jgi:hypothetical protein
MAHETLLPNEIYDLLFLDYPYKLHSYKILLCQCQLYCNDQMLLDAYHNDLTRLITLCQGHSLHSYIYICIANLYTTPFVQSRVSIWISVEVLNISFNPILLK